MRQRLLARSNAAGERLPNGRTETQICTLMIGRVCAIVITFAVAQRRERNATASERHAHRRTTSRKSFVKTALLTMVIAGEPRRCDPEKVSDFEQ